MRNKIVDQVGNEVELHDWLHFNLPSTSVMGVVMEIQTGSTLGIRGTKSGKIEENVTMGRMVLRIDVPLNFDPRENMIHGSLKVVKPPEAVEAEAKAKGPSLIKQ